MPYLRTYTYGVVPPLDILTIAWHAGDEDGSGSPAEHGGYHIASPMWRDGQGDAAVLQLILDKWGLDFGVPSSRDGVSVRVRRVPLGMDRLCLTIESPEVLHRVLTYLVETGYDEPIPWDNERESEPCADMASSILETLRIEWV